jgi:stalled ribosome rescue protein Dom34
MANKKYRRGYPVAILAGLEKDDASLWQVFSKVVKPIVTIKLDENRNNLKAVFNFHESIVNALRPTFKEGVRSVILASPPRTGYAQDFIYHVQRHHAWLVQRANKITFAEAAGSAKTPSQVAALTRTETFQSLILGITSEETVNLLELLEKRISTSTKANAVLFSLEEAESLFSQLQKANGDKPEYLLLTNEYFAKSRQKNRLNRLLQIAANHHVKTRIVSVESPVSKRLMQLGGFVCLAKSK